MPRRQYVADLQQAINSPDVKGICDLHAGEDDGQFTFVFQHGYLEKPAVITAIIPDLDDYPKRHTYLVCAADDTPSDVADVLSSKLGSTDRKTITQLLLIVSVALAKHMADEDDEMVDDHTSVEEFEQAEEEMTGYDLDFDDEGSIASSPDLPTNVSAQPIRTTIAIRNRIRADLRAAKDAGFRVSCHGGLLEGSDCVVSISIRIGRLGIAEPAMQAWQVEPSEYLVLAIQYPSYMTLDQLIAARSQTASISMRVRVSSRYKPTQKQASDTFQKVFATGKSSIDSKEDNHGFRPVFLSNSLEHLLNNRLLSILEFRNEGLSRLGAEEFLAANRGGRPSGNVTDAHYYEDEELDSAYPSIVDADHWNDNPSTPSFPLLAMQMVLRHFARCTEFCVVCHKKMESGLEAIKPYVCDEDLCLYQYLAMGFGPSIEHEIMAQPYTVDLLISFAFVQAASGRLKVFPHGLNMIIPPSFGTKNVLVQKLTARKSKVRFDHQRCELIFDTTNTGCPLRAGDWIAIEQEDAPDNVIYCRVNDVCFYPTIRVDPSIGGAFSNNNVTAAAAAYPSTSDPKSCWRPASFEKFDLDFDDLGHDSKLGAIMNLLDLLPNVREIRTYLLGQGTPDLSRWIQRIPPAALGVLRWVIASNRACIMQTYDMDIQGKPITKEETVYGMKQWMQFRFAMGAPDKEKRFLTCVRETASRLDLHDDHRTLFAWHGSALHNWHSIIREGLNFDETVNGRAYGHGVYHSLDLNTSLLYSRASHGYNNPHLAWSNSLLQINTAVALNEIVNAPEEFRARQPHLVVQHVNWIQTRYLFVKCSGESVIDLQERKPMKERPQSGLAPRNEACQTLVIPAQPVVKLVVPAKSVVKRKVHRKRASSGIKKTKGMIGSAKNRMPVNGDTDVEFGDDDDKSDMTDPEDLDVLFDEDIVEPLMKIDLQPQTDFVPGELDHSILPRLPLPPYADPRATSMINKDWLKLLKIQNSSALHELGWYIDPAKFDSPYQWIVELHSFDKDLPLATDMKKAGLKSVVLEMRFPGSYPMDPPFVRVIKPRFLPFASGGGGHVTAGGALCMELLTGSGWSPVSSLESVLLQVRMAISSTDPKPARVSGASQVDYGIGEAVEAYKRACRNHGWTVPLDFDKMTKGGHGLN